MERSRSPGGVVCNICGEDFTIPEDGVDGNLPRSLLCSHIFCTRCLQSIECSGVILCPECKVDSVLPEGGVLGLQEDNGIIGLIYISKINKKKIEKQGIHELSPPSDVNSNTEDMEQPVDSKNTLKMVDEALARAVEKHAQLMRIHETLKVGLDKQLNRESVRLNTEIRLVVAKAVKIVRKWGDGQFNLVSNLESHFSVSQNQVDLVQQKIRSLETAMENAMEFRRLPVAEQYYSFEEVLEPLQAPVDPHSFDMNCINLDSGLSLPEAPCQKCELTGKKCPWQCADVKDGWSDMSGNSKGLTSSKKRPLNIQSSSSSSPEPPRGTERSNVSHYGSAVNLTNPDVIIEEITERIDTPTPIPSQPEQTIKKKRVYRKGKKSLSDNRNVPQWVTVTHIVSPSHFYIHYVTETKEHVKLSKRISDFCKESDCCFSSTDTLEKGSLIFVKWKEEMWCRAIVMELHRRGHPGVVDVCSVAQLAGVRVFFLDNGLSVSLQPNSDDSSDWTLKEVNAQMKKVGDEVKLELSSFAPQAVRCCLKNIVPNDLTHGWSREAQEEFVNLVGCAVIQMKPLGQDRESLQVDLRKTPVDQSTNGPISIREYLVYSGLARFYSPVATGRKPLRFYPPIKLRIDQEYNAVVSHINTPADFHIQLVDNSEYLSLSAKLQECYNVASGIEDLSLIVHSPDIGQACVAQYEDNLWYRAQVIGQSEADKVNVNYVDFGNTRIVSVSNLRKIKEEFFWLPSMAIHCCLSEILPLDGKTWSEACSNRFISLAHQKLVTLVVTDEVPNNRPHPVKLLESDMNSLKSDIAHILVNEGLACLIENAQFDSAMPPCDEIAIWDTPLDLSTPRNIEVCERTLAQDENNSAFEPCLKFPQELKDIEVRVSHVSSPSSFYVQFAEYDNQLKRLSELLKQGCRFPEPSGDVEWKEDMFCAAYINGVWDRAQVLSDVPSCGIADVIRCDHGNKTKVHISNLQLLPSSLIGSFALECTLTDIRPAGGRASWTATACDFISDFLSGFSAVITIQEATDLRPVPVTLSCINKYGQFITISDVLASEGLALRDKKPPPRVCVIQRPNDEKIPGEEMPADRGDCKTPDVPVPAVRTSCPKPTPRLILSSEKVTTGPYQPPELPPTGHMQTVICAVGEDGLIYARTKNSELDLEKLIERIQQRIRSPPRPNLYTWKSVQGCAVMGPDMVWYRGQVLEVLGGHLKVRYVDYGLVENIPVVHAHPVLLCDDVPQLCVPCQLQDVNPVGGQWQSDAIMLLRELLQDRPVDMDVLELPADPRAPVTIELFLDGQRLSRILSHHKHSSVTGSVKTGISSLNVAHSSQDWSIDVENLKVRDKQTFESFISPALPPVSSRFQVSIKHLQTPNELYLRPMDGVTEVRVDGETLDKALSRINENIDSLPRLTCFPEGAQCLAEYSDGKYYRAKLIRLVSVEPVLVMVQHVDFGSDDTLSLSKLRQMPAELLQFPLQVVRVSVGGLKPPRVQEEDEVLPYSPQWSLKAAQAMTDLLHGNISASVVTVEPELTVKLYNHEGDLVHLPLVSSGLAELD